MQETKLIEAIKKQNLNPKEWVTAKEGANIIKIYSSKQIHSLGEKGVERVGKIKIGGTVVYNLKDILQYAANHQKKPILSPVWDELKFLEGEHLYPLVGYDLKYFISNKQRVFDLSNGRMLTAQPHRNDKGNLTGYATVCLLKDGKPKQQAIHRLIGKTQCPNVFNYDIYHHISNVRHNGLYDNRASNILPVANTEVHNKLHHLMTNDKKAYAEMVAKIKKDNKQKVYKIPDLDFGSNEHYSYYMLINAAGYKAYKKSGDVPLDCILMQIAEAKND